MEGPTGSLGGPRPAEVTAGDEGEPTRDEDRLLVGVRPHGAARVVYAGGEMDAATVTALRSTLWPLLEVRSSPVVVDLSWVSFLAVAAMRLLAQARDRAAECGVVVRVVLDRSQPVVARMAEAGALGGLVLLDDLGEALESVRAGDGLPG